MAWRVLPMFWGFCLLSFSYGEENESHTELQRAKQVPVSSTGPGPMHQDVASVLGLEQEYQNPDIMLMSYRLRLRRHAEKKKKKHSAGAFSPLSAPKDGKKTQNSRNKRHERPKNKKMKLVKQLLKHNKPHHEHTSPTEILKVPQRKQVKKPQPGVFSVLSYSAQNNERSHGQKEDLDD
ncbi:hypothetical protein KOW79_006190 [Hemibagrus wyckioides]|uniref:Uncharacterized protein n=1 Tax=Hemibagrus wyckioides TaxID=337641 RepID=A0A9D3NZ64_9TELE|nr:hypothetical protein KOW79_006190 [Hemibagrus wyckioides]